MSAIHVQRGDQKFGPFTTEELEGKVEAGELFPEDLFWSEGMDEWQPLSTVITVEPPEDDTPEDSNLVLTPEEVGILHEIGGTTVTTHAVHLESGEVLPLEQITKVEVQTEKVRRTKSIAVCVILGVLIVSLALVELPRTTASHWIIWGAVLIGLTIWWFRVLVRILRVGATMVVIDLKDGDERIIRAAPEMARQVCEAINLSRPVGE